ncbi:hypothetical protein DFH08DRAFT_864607 [Mycena albidolilacea]|uniref:Uncharacterized protein n=1 Tax=Mycena albidolilacea TaxID=1033008 RepID=A0AAD7EUA9_9AGAR|nr:hypothetical protein DFH08DRAFT_864607 [Mycena albidolilacea]
MLLYYFLTFFVLATFCRADSIPIAPAPWNLTVSEAYAFVVAPPPSPAFLPPGFADPLEAPELAPGVILPDSGLIMILRYSASPVDDELIYIPGRWAYNLTDSGLRITRIYVATNASVFNGKDSLSASEHQADFNFTKLADGSQTVTVFPPGDLTNPHFSAKLTPTIGPVPIEVNTALTSDHLTFIQPSIPASPTNPVEVGTTTWKQVLLNIQTETWTATVISGALPGGKIGNGIGYPDIQPLLPIGVSWSGPLIFPAPSIVPNL